MRPEPILAPLIMGRRPKHVCHYPSLGPIRYKKLEKITDVRYGYPLFPTCRFTLFEFRHFCSLVENAERVEYPEP